MTICRYVIYELTIIQSFGVYLAHFLQTNTFPEASSLDYAFIGGLQFSLSMLMGPLVTLFVRKFGTKPPMLIGVALQTAGFISASFSKRIWQLYISQGLLLGIGQGFIFIPFSPIVPQWFSKKRTLAMGIGSAGSGVGGLLFSFGIQAMIDNISLGWAFRITAFITLVMNTLAIALTRDRHSSIRPPLLGFDRKLLFRYDVFLLLGWAFVSMLGYITILYSMSDFSTSIGLSKQNAAAISAFLNLGTAIGRPLAGFISDRYGRIKIAGLCTFLCGLLCFAIWIPAKSYGVTILFAILSGAVVGIFWMTIGPISVEVVGLPQVPSLLSLVWLVVVPPTLCKPEKPWSAIPSLT